MNIESVGTYELRVYDDLLPFEQELVEQSDTLYFADKFESVFGLDEFSKVHHIPGVDAIASICHGIAVGIKLIDDESIELFNITD